MARADASQTLAALTNIIRNAIEAVEHQQPAEVVIEAERNGDWVTISVSDSGDGVSESARERLFEPLVTTKALGIGLGLSIARSLVQNQGGDIRFESSSLGGATFIIELPAADGLRG